MNRPPQPTTPRSSVFPQSGRRVHSGGFTMVEVMVAAFVLVLAISSSLIVIQAGMRAVDTARYTTLAGQILQSQMEKLRLLNWTQLTYSTGPLATRGPVAFSTFFPDLTATATAQLKRFIADEVDPITGTVVTVEGKCSQTITAAPSPFSATMKEITLTARWIGMDGRQHSLSYVTYYGKNGISDFFYTSH